MACARRRYSHGEGSPSCYQEDDEFPTLKGNTILQEVVAFTLLGSANKDVDSSMYWMDGCMKKLISREGNIFSSILRGL